ncbi:MAG: T9SS type A sorting domain-containing protein, partial [Saprospiraceae bacterium]|nr:T9SS type A sorting domain-containing protein [Saprospiraceae bacterium]
IKGEPNGCASFFYTLDGDQRNHETDVSIKAGRERGLGFDNVGANCDCDGSVPLMSDAFVQDIPLWEELDEVPYNEISLSITAYPNPASNYIYLKLNGFEEAAAEIQIIDVLGRIVLQQKQGYTKHGVIELSIPDGIQDGLYFVRLKNSRPVKGVPIVIYKRN